MFRGIRVLIGRFALFLPVGLSAQSKPLVSVVAFSAENVAKTEAVTLTRLFESAISKLNVFMVVEQSEAETILKHQGYSQSDCTDEACAAEIGKLLSAQNVFVGTVSRIESLYVLTVKLIDVAQERDLKTETGQGRSTTALALAERLGSVAEAMREAGTVTGARPASSRRRTLRARVGGILRIALRDEIPWRSIPTLRGASNGFRSPSSGLALRHSFSYDMTVSDNTKE